MLAYTWHTGKPGAKGRIPDPDRDQIRRAAFLTFVVGTREPVEETIKLAGLRWKLVQNKKGKKRRDVLMPHLVLVYRRIGRRPDCGGGG